MSVLSEIRLASMPTDALNTAQSKAQGGALGPHWLYLLCKDVSMFP